jgi:uncharacterized membrane protein
VSETPVQLPDFTHERRSLPSRLRTWFLTGMLVLGPTTITMWVLYRLLSVVDGVLGRYIKFPALEAPFLPEGRIPGLGLIAMLVLLLLAGMIASSLAGTGMLAAWERMLTRLPIARIIYSATKGLGEAFLSGRRTAFRQVLLVEYPRPGVWVLGFRSADPPAELHEKAGTRLVAVFIPNTPNPTSGYFRLVPEEKVRPLELTVEQAVKLIASAGVVQTPGDALPGHEAAPDDGRVG